MHAVTRNKYAKIAKIQQQAQARNADALIRSPGTRTRNHLLQQLLGLLVEGLRNVRDDAGLLNLLAALGTLVLIGYGPVAENLALRESLDALLAAQPQPSAPVHAQGCGRGGQRICSGTALGWHPSDGCLQCTVLAGLQVRHANVCEATQPLAAFLPSIHALYYYLLCFRKTPKGISFLYNKGLLKDA